MADPPLVMLTNAILLSSLKKQASAITVRFDDDHCVVEFLLEGVLVEEMQPPVKLYPMICRRLAIMANLPMYGKGDLAYGRIHLRIGDRGSAYFDVAVCGHGSEMRADVIVHGFMENEPPRIEPDDD